jgi:hypothetical protein
MVVGIGRRPHCRRVVGPAALSGWFARSLGHQEAFARALRAPSIELALVFGLAFLALGYPDDVRNGERAGARVVELGP